MGGSKIALWIYEGGWNAEKNDSLIIFLLC